MQVPRDSSARLVTGLPSSQRGTAPRVFAYPKGKSAYTESFYGAVEALGVRVIPGLWSRSWLDGSLRPGDCVHLHWPSLAYQTLGSASDSTRRFLSFCRFLLHARRRRARLIWTAHNLMPHEASSPATLDVLGRNLLIWLSERILVHSASAADVLASRFPEARSKLAIIPHGNWIDLYPRTATVAEARARLGIPQQTYVYGFVGACRRYKNLGGLLAAFRTLPAQPDLALLIAGSFADQQYRDEILSAARVDPRVRVYPQFVPDDQLQLYLLASDVVVLPYTEILTSGAAMLALSFGRPVVTISAGFLRDIISGDVGILYNPRDPGALAKALREVRDRSFEESLVIAHSRHYTFPAAARIFVDVLLGSSCA